MLFDRYIKNKRGKAAVFGLAFILVLSLFAEFIANDKPIILKYQGEYFFPIAKVYTDARFGGDFPTEANYKDELIRRNIEAEGFMVMPPIEFSYNTVDYDLNEPFPAPPSARHLLGTDEEGRDIAARLLYGVRLSFAFAFLLTLLSSAIGIFVGAVQGYFGGKTDIILQRLIEIWESMPQMFILIIVASVFVPSFWTLLAKMPCSDRDGLKLQLVSSFTNGRTDSLREMTLSEYNSMIREMEKQTGSSRPVSYEVLKKKRSAVLHQMQLMGIDTANWAAVDNFCLGVRIAGKKFRELSADDLDAVLLRIRSIRQKDMQKAKKELN